MARYEAKCQCGWVTSINRSPDHLRLVLGSGDLGGKTCRCGNGGFVFRLVSKKLRAKLTATLPARS